MLAKKEDNADDDVSLNTNPSTIPVRACASTRTDPNTRTGMSIASSNENLRILVPT